MLRLLELYTSIQGECDKTGTPTIFVRFAGCNLRCEGWKCDTPFAIYPRQFMKEQELVSVRRPAYDPSKLTREQPPPDLIWRITEQARETGAKNIALTGGEPMLQPRDELIDLVRSLRGNWDYTVEMFSNGTLEYPPELLTHCSIRMDWKLPGSGEFEAPGRDVRVNNYYSMIASIGCGEVHTVKFTIKNQADFEEAMAIYEKYDMEDWPGSIYAGPVWDSEFTAKDVADGILANRLPWRLNIQTHKYVYTADPQARGI